MASIEVRVAVQSKVGDPAPSVRVFVDPVPEGGLSSESELPLTRRGGPFVGTFVLPRDGSTIFFYRVGIVARVGAVWTLSFRTHGTNRELLCDSDSMETAKVWLAGSCFTWPGVGARGECASQGSANDSVKALDSGRPRLRLV